MKKFLATITFLFLLITLNAQSISTTGFSPSEVRPMKLARYTVIIKDLRLHSNRSSLPIKLPRGLQEGGSSSSTSMQTQMRNGNIYTERSTTLTLSFVAEEEGRYTIPEWSITENGNTYTVPAQTLIVSNNAPELISTTNSRNQTEEIDISNLLEAKIDISRDKIYIGESVPCKVVLGIDKTIYAQAHLRLNNIRALVKDAKDFTCQALPENPKIDETSSSTQFLLEYNTIITPNKVGEYPLSYTIAGDFFRPMTTAMNRAIMNNPLTLINRNTGLPFNETAEIDNIKVSPLPRENCPDSFSGGIGEFSLSNSNIDQSSASVGDLLKLSFTISGVGNFDRITAPKLESSPDWKVYEATSEFINKDGNAFVGEKTFTYRIVPQKPDLEYSPALSFSYFNPIKEQYQSLEIPREKLSISPASRVNTIANNNPAPQLKDGNFDIISDKISLDEETISLFAKAEFWVCQVIIIALIILAIAYRRHVLFLKSNPAIVKNSKERRASRIHLKFAKKYAFESNSKNFFESAIKAIQFALSRTENIEAPSITLKDAQRLLEKRGLDLPEINKFFDGIDAMNYAGAKSKTHDLMQLEKELRDICKKLLR